MKEIAKHFVRWGSILLALGMLVHWHFAIFVGARHLTPIAGS